MQICWNRPWRLQLVSELGICCTLEILDSWACSDQMSSNPWAKYNVKGGSRNFQVNYYAKVSSTFSDVLNSHIRLPGNSSVIYLHPHLRDLFKYQHLLLLTNLKKLNTNPECIQIYWEHLWYLVLRLLVKEAADSEDCWPSQPSILSAFWHSFSSSLTFLSLEPTAAICYHYQIHVHKFQQYTRFKELHLSMWFNSHISLAGNRLMRRPVQSSSITYLPTLKQNPDGPSHCIHN